MISKEIREAIQQANDELREATGGGFFHQHTIKMLDRAEEILTRPKYPALVRKVAVTLAVELGFEKGEGALLEAVAKALADVVEFPKVTDKMVDDFAKDEEQTEDDSFWTALCKLRQACKDGKYA